VNLLVKPISLCAFIGNPAREVLLPLCFSPLQPLQWLQCNDHTDYRDCNATDLPALAKPLAV
jgi:hypothetical protein